MAILEDVIDLIQGIAADTASPLPGFFTITTIAKLLLFRGLLSEKGKGDTPSKRQLQYIRNLVSSRQDIFETKRVGGKTYFRLR